MLLSCLKAITVLLLLVGGWLLVLAAWRRVFPGIPPGEDVLASRISCLRCPRESPCPHPTSDPPNPPSRP